MSSPGARLTLVIPPLFEGLRQVTPVPRLPALERLIVRGARAALPDGSSLHHLAALFGLVPQGDLPLGAICRVGEYAAADDGWWYCAAPAHFFAARDRLRLAAIEAVQQEEADALVSLFNSHFSADGWELEAPAPSRWYLRAPGAQALRTRPISEAAASDLRGALPEGPDALRCHRFLNEAQMLFHSSAINSGREQRGLPAINGLWFWGGGRVPELPRRFDRVWSDDPLTRGLALVSGATAQPLPGCLPPLTGTALAVLDPEGEPAAWRRMEAGWFGAAERELRAGRLDELIIAGTTYVTRAKKRDLRRWWRLRRSLEKFP